MYHPPPPPPPPPPPAPPGDMSGIPRPPPTIMHHAPPPPYGIIPPSMSVPVPVPMMGHQFPMGPSAASLDPLSTGVLVLNLPSPYIDTGSFVSGPSDGAFVSPQTPIASVATTTPGGQAPKNNRASVLLRELASATTYAHSGVKAVHSLSVPEGKAGAAVIRMGSKAGAASLCRMLPLALPGVRCLPSRAVMAFPGTIMDDSEVSLDEGLMEKLKATAERHREQGSNGASVAGKNKEEEGEKSGSTTVSATPTTAETIEKAPPATMQALDANKVAAAAGGQYDEEEDPLNAPEVLEAVANFKKNIEEQHAASRKKRAEEVRKRVRDRMKWAHDQATAARRPLEQNPPASAASEGAPPPPPQSESGDAANPTKDSGRRGISNLPAWMTKDGGADEKSLKRPLATSADGFVGLSDRRRPRLEGVEGVAAIRAANEAADAAAAIVASATAAGSGEAVPWEEVERLNLAASLRPWVSGKIEEYLGEREETMIDFVMDQVRKRCKREDILEEMRPVLDEDADVFVTDLWKILVKCRVE
uniref:PWI domain-containing protein n=1 Tax=Corethron hystrix TaxID=216773 RepID=A0A6U5LJJ4_9STRA|mmetsp:Transcript_5843/g.12369  ORF Transcript_5843/g.12369 Transcript_5843/m.12369 type:complete len:533 (+) Transcript_5843:59-1657(+)